MNNHTSHCPKQVVHAEEGRHALAPAWSTGMCGYFGSTCYCCTAGGCAGSNFMMTSLPEWYSTRPTAGLAVACWNAPSC